MDELSERDKEMIQFAMATATETAASCVEQCAAVLPSDATVPMAMQAAANTIRTLSRERWPTKGIA